MVSERIQRRIDGPPDEAVAAKDWATVVENAQADLRIDEPNEDALAVTKMPKVASRGKGDQDSSEPSSKGPEVDQEHDHQGRREHLSSRGRGVSIHPSSDRDAQVIGVPDERT